MIVGETGQECDSRKNCSSLSVGAVGLVNSGCDQVRVRVRLVKGVKSLQ